MESMDRGGKLKVNDSKRWIFGKWYWSKLGQYTLRKGKHRFILHNWLGGARLDAIVFTRDPQVQPHRHGRGSARTVWQPGAGTVTTAPVQPSGCACLAEALARCRPQRRTRPGPGIH